MKLGEPTVWLRKEVILRLGIARTELAKLGFQLVVYDGWRPIEVQRNLFWIYLAQYTAPQYSTASSLRQLRDPVEIESRFSQLDDNLQEELKRATLPYVSWPSSDPTKPSPHATGGVVDVWLWRNDKPADLGVHYDEMTAAAATFHYHLLCQQPVSHHEQRVSRDRYHLIVDMAKVGFSCYPPEIWHFNYGNQMHPLVEGGKAKYSYTEPG